MKGTPMRWLRDRHRRAFVLLLVLALLGYFVVYGVVFPLLWPYRDHPLVWFVLALLSGGHLEGLCQLSHPEGRSGCVLGCKPGQHIIYACAEIS
jgi:hypothetical protein